MFTVLPVAESPPAIARLLVACARDERRSLATQAVECTLSPTGVHAGAFETHGKRPVVEHVAFCAPQSVRVSTPPSPISLTLPSQRSY